MKTPTTLKLPAFLCYLLDTSGASPLTEHCRAFRVSGPLLLLLLSDGQLGLVGSLVSNSRDSQHSADQSRSDKRIYTRRLTQKQEASLRSATAPYQRKTRKIAIQLFTIITKTGNQLPPQKRKSGAKTLKLIWQL